MNHRHKIVHRRNLLLGGAAAVIASVLKPGNALALTGVAALDTPSLKVKAPARVLLVAVTQTPGGRLVAVGEHGVIIFSDDNGVTWAQAAVPVNVTLTCVRFATSMTGWAVGHFGVILNTDDGGATWQMQLDGIQANQLTEQAAQDPSVANSPSPGAPLAEKRAEHFLSEGPDKPFLTLLVLEPQKVLAFGAYRMAMLTEDGGKTWCDWSLHIYDRLSHNIYDAQAIGSEYYIVGEMGLVFCSSDGGNTFLPLTAPANVTLFGILGARNGALIVFGVAGSAFRSIDGGKSWTPLVIPTQEDLTAGRVLPSGAVVMVSESGLLFESMDNGITYRAISGVQPQPFFDIDIARDGALIAVGAAGITKISKELFLS